MQLTAQSLIDEIYSVLCKMGTKYPDAIGLVPALARTTAMLPSHSGVASSLLMTRTVRSQYLFYIRECRSLSRSFIKVVCKYVYAFVPSISLYG